MDTCPLCQGPLDPTTRRCQQCGRLQPAAPDASTLPASIGAAVPARTWHCSSCHAEVPQGMNFCGYCGRPLAASGIQVPPTLVSPTQPARAVPPAPAAPGSPVPGAAPLSSPTPPPPSLLGPASGPDQVVLPPYPQPSQPASASPRISRRTAIIGAVGVGAAGVLTTLCTRTAWFSFLVKSLSSRGASAEVTPTVSTNPLLLYTYRGHKSEPDLLLWSPDSTKLISADDSANPYHVWDVLTGAHASIFDLSTIKSRMQGGENDVGWTASGPCLGWTDLNSPPVVHVTNLVSGQEVTNVAIPFSEAGDLRWSPDGNYLAIASELIVILEAGSGKTIATFPPPTSAGVETDLTWSPDSQRLAVSYYNGAIVIWELSSGKRLSTYQKYTNSGDFIDDPGNLLWSSDSTTLASMLSQNPSTIDIWSAQDGRQLYTYTGLTSGTNMVGWSADHSLFAARDSDSGQLFVWNASTHQSLRTLPTYQSGDIVWAPDSPHLAAPGTVSSGMSSPGNAFIVWNATTGQQLASYTSPSGSESDVVAWSPNGKYIATAYGGDSNVYIWKAPELLPA